jgi:predicted lipid-binding transport protein (Tim44 family)
MISRSRFLPVLGVGLVLAMSAGDADAARRGGGFGSRGMRTYSMPRATQTAPRPAAPIERSMTPRDQLGGPQAARPNAASPLSRGMQPQRGSFLRRWGGPILGGLLAAGLFGMLMGHGFGGAAGMTALLFQIGLIAILAMLAMAFLRRRQAGAQMAGPRMSGLGPNVSQFQDYRDSQPSRDFMGAEPGVQPRGATHLRDGDEIGLTDADFDEFERLLGQIQVAFGRADYDTMRANATPEAMSYLSEELGRYAADGLRNTITDVRLLQGDLSEAWREDDADYATVAMRFSSVDVTRDASGRVVAGDPDRPSETVELWTFKKVLGPWGERWKLAAIQDA